MNAIFLVIILDQAELRGLSDRRFLQTILWLTMMKYSIHYAKIGAHNFDD